MTIPMNGTCEFFYKSNKKIEATAVKKKFEATYEQRSHPLMTHLLLILAIAASGTSVNLLREELIDAWKSRKPKRR